jgi:hypothetical protein
MFFKLFANYLIDEHFIRILYGIVLQSECFFDILNRTCRSILSKPVGPLNDAI